MVRDDVRLIVSDRGIFFSVKRPLQKQAVFFIGRLAPVQKWSIADHRSGLGGVNPLAQKNRWHQ